MRIYLLNAPGHRLGADIAALATGMTDASETVNIEAAHESVRRFFVGKPSGVVIVPTIWEDLLCVKIVQELRRLPEPFEVVLVGAAPAAPADLCEAFNEGAAAIVPTPANADTFRNAVSRAGRALERDEARRFLLKKLKEEEREEEKLENDAREKSLRDRRLAQAFLDLTAGVGPFSERGVRALLVSSSSAQVKCLTDFLTHLNVNVTTVTTMKDAEAKLPDGHFHVVISDNVLSDGAATTLAKRIRAVLTAEIPALIVWTSSPETIEALSSPDFLIDSVVMKPEGKSGFETLLLELVACVYRQA